MLTTPHITPKASFCCATYRRPALLCELLYCFLGQDWPNKELVIVNDEPEQQLIFDHPDVKIINWPRRMSHLGLKRNFAVSQCTGEYVFHVDDDDLYLPHKMRHGVENRSKMGIFKTDLIILDTEPMELVRGKLPSNYMFTHRAFAMAGGYDVQCEWGGDPRMMGMTDMFMELLGETCGAVEEPSYIYRWCTTPYHNSSGRAFPSDAEMQRGMIHLEPRKPATDMNNLVYEERGRRLSEVLRFTPADMHRFYKGIRNRALAE